MRFPFLSTHLVLSFVPSPSFSHGALFHSPLILSVPFSIWLYLCLCFWSNLHLLLPTTSLLSLVRQVWHTLTTHHTKIVLSRTEKGSSAVPIGEPFEEPILVPDTTRLRFMYHPFHRGFYMEPQRVLPGNQKGLYLEPKRVRLGDSHRTLLEPLYIAYREHTFHNLLPSPFSPFFHSSFHGRRGVSASAAWRMVWDKRNSAYRDQASPSGRETLFDPTRRATPRQAKHSQANPRQDRNRAFPIRCFS